ncbi:MAG: hypothetical protein Q8M20_13985 [Rhodocyclaceae bacterium]|nr:hypothetical protein [Rhodocyclaceae bacterium]MDZ4216110.1 hypothetical protein [Rhodocyclaceae bacterium]
MFRLFGKRQASANEDETSALLATLTGSPAAVLQQVLDWVEEQAGRGALDQACLLQADERLESVRADIEAERLRQRQLGTGQRLLRTYCERIGQAYAAVARKLPVGHADAVRIRLRAIHLLGRASRLARTAQEEDAATRTSCLALFSEAHQAGVAVTRKPPYAGMADSSMAQELAITLLWETIPFDALTPEQADYLERLLTHNGAQIIMKTSAGATAPFAVLANGQVLPPLRGVEATPLLFIGPGPLAAQLAALAKLPNDAALPAWAGEPIPGTSMLTLKTMAQRICMAWERKQIARVGERTARGDAVCVTGGFANIRRAIAYAAYVRGGGRLDAYDRSIPFVSERAREIMVGLEQENREYTPLEILVAMESAGDSKAVETWPVRDSSPQGYSLAVPGYRPWLGVGSLLAVRESLLIDWQLAIVRRLYGAAKQRQGGLEILQGAPLPVGMGEEGKTDNVSLAELRDAILLSSPGQDRLIVPFACTPGGLYLLAGQFGRRRYRLGDLVHGNASFSLYDCVPADPGTL